MEVPKAIFKFATLVLMALLAVAVIWGLIQRKLWNDRGNSIGRLYDTLAVEGDRYESLLLETGQLSSLLTQRGEEVDRLKRQIDQQKLELLAVNQFALKWKKAYEGVATASQIEVVLPSGVRKKVEFSKSFDMYEVNGWTLTDPPEAWVKLDQRKPLRLTVAISQDKDGSWRTHVTSNDENTAVQVVLGAVNPHLLDPRWYEKIQLNLSAAVGTGALVGVGASYRIGQFDVGPAAFLGIGDGLDRYFGATLGWRPFQRN